MDGLQDATEKLNKRIEQRNLRKNKPVEEEGRVYGKRYHRQNQDKDKQDTDIDSDCSGFEEIDDINISKVESGKKKRHILFVRIRNLN